MLIRKCSIHLVYFLIRAPECLALQRDFVELQNCRYFAIELT